MRSNCKLAKVISTLFVVIAMFGVGAMPAWADGERESQTRANTDPTNFYFTLYANPQTWQYTEQRYKQNTSNCYVKANMSPNCSGINFSVWSWTTSGITCNNTVNGVAYMPYALRGTVCHIRNTVIQNHWPGCGLVGQAYNPTSTVTVSGEWSPDSTGYGHELN